mgnify:CR=1 FL=1
MHAAQVTGQCCLASSSAQWPAAMASCDAFRPRTAAGDAPRRWIAYVLAGGACEAEAADAEAAAKAKAAAARQRRRTRPM